MTARDCRAGRNTGIALLSVLLVVAVLAAIVYRLTAQHSLNLAQSRNSFGFDQALAYALGGEALVRQALMDDLLNSGPEVDTLQEVWAQALPPLELDERGFIEIQARDLNGCFNLNALAADQPDAHLERFRTLLRNLDVPEPVADAARDWVDADQTVFRFGAEDTQYLGLQPPHRTADRRFAHASELRLLHGLEAEHWRRLNPHVCALPSTALKVNVNTAGSQVLAAMQPNLSAAALLGLIGKTREYADVAGFTAQHPDFTPAQDALAVTSDYFEAQVRVRVDGHIAVLTSVLLRDPATKTIALLARDFGRNFRSRFVVQGSEEADARGS